MMSIFKKIWAWLKAEDVQVDPEPPAAPSAQLAMKKADAPAKKAPAKKAPAKKATSAKKVAAKKKSPPKS